MLNETFYLDGIDARSAGIQLQSPIEFSEAVPVVEAQSVPGRNGDLLLYTGSYENRSGSASCFCLQKDVGKSVSSAGRFLMAKMGYRRLETSDDPDHYWMAMVENTPQISMRLRTLAPFEIGFDCKPQRFLKIGEMPVEFVNPGSIFNQYGQVASPLLIVHYRDNPVVKIGDCSIELKGLWYDYDILNAELKKTDATSLDTIEFGYLPDGVTWEQYLNALNNCQGNAKKLSSDLFQLAPTADWKKYLGDTETQIQPAFDATLASDWELVVYLDSETENAYNENGHANSSVNAPVFPVLKDGETKITWEGWEGWVRKIEIIPRWWEI